MALLKPCARWLLAGALLSVACDEPQLSVTFVLPTDHGRDLVNSASLQVLKVPLNNPFGCYDLAQGNVDRNLVEASLLSKVRLLGRKNTHVSGIERLGDKLLWATALDDSGEVVFVACVPVSDIDGYIPVELQGAPAPLVSIPDYQNPGVRPRLADWPQSVDVLVTDVLSMPLADVEVFWRMNGPRGTESVGTARTDADGRFLLELGSGPFGPSRLEVHVPWQRNNRPVVSGFRRPVAHMVELDVGLSDLRVVRTGDNGRTALVGYTASDGGPTNTDTLTYHYYDGLEQGFAGKIIDIDYHFTPWVVVAAEQLRDRVLVLSPVAWDELDLSTGSLIQHSAPAELERIWRAVPFGSCPPQGSAEALVLLDLLESSGHSLAVCDFKGACLQNHPLTTHASIGRPTGSGCVADQNGRQHRVAVFEDAHEKLGQILVADTSAIVTIDWEGEFGPHGYSPAFAFDNAMLLRVKAGPEGLELVRSRLHVPTSNNEQIYLADVDRYPAYGTPLAVVSGDIDGDQRADIVARELAFAGSHTEAVQVILGAESQEASLSAMLVPQSAGWNTALAVGDLDGDGIDDLAVASFIADTEKTVIEIYLMGGSR